MAGEHIVQIAFSVNLFSAVHQQVAAKAPWKPVRHSVRYCQCRDEGEQYWLLFM